MDAKVFVLIGPISREQRDLIEAAESFLSRARDVASICGGTLQLSEGDINRQMAEGRVAEARTALQRFEDVARAATSKTGALADTRPLWEQRCARALTRYNFSSEQWDKIVNECMSRDQVGEVTSPREVACEILGIFNGKVGA